MKKHLLWLGCYCAAAGAWAEPVYRPLYHTCVERAVSTADNIRCVQTETAFQDGRLNQAYRTLMQAYPPAQQKTLQKAQKAWNVYKKESTKLISMKDGSLYRLLANANYLKLTTERAQELEEAISMIN